MRERLEQSKAEKRQGRMESLRERAAKRCRDLTEQRALAFDEEE